MFFFLNLNLISYVCSKREKNNLDLVINQGDTSANSDSEIISKSSRLSSISGDTFRGWRIAVVLGDDSSSCSTCATSAKNFKDIFQWHLFILEKALISHCLKINLKNCWINIFRAKIRHCMQFLPFVLSRHCKKFRFSHQF